LNRLAASRIESVVRAESTLSISDALRCFTIRSLVAAPVDGANRALLREILLGRTSNFINTDYLFLRKGAPPQHQENSCIE
jgi:hypothetical protein